MAYREGSDPAEDCTGWALPEAPLPVTVEFREEMVVGEATLSRDENGNIHAKAVIAVPEHLLRDHRYFAIGGTFTQGRERGVLRSMAVDKLAICCENTDPELAPFLVFP